MQVVESGITIVIITPISERVTVDDKFVCIVGRQVSFRHVAPSIIGVSSYFCSTGVVYRNYVALQILFEVIRYEIIECITLSRRVIYTYRATVFIVYENENIIAPSLRNYSATVKQVLIFRSEIISFTRSYSVRIISIRRRGVIIFITTLFLEISIRGKLSAFPSKLVTVIETTVVLIYPRGISYLVIGDIISAVKGQKISPSRRAIGIILG